jgi:hypothetical protein
MHHQPEPTRTSREVQILSAVANLGNLSNPKIGTAGFEPTTSCTPNGPKTSKNQRKTPGMQRILEKPAGFSMLFKT